MATTAHDTEAPLLRDWLAEIDRVMGEIEGWARDLGWDSRRFPLRVSESRLGEYDTQQLLIQRLGGTGRLVVEPVARFGVGADGLIDLFDYPDMDPVATLYCESGRWYLHDNTARDAAGDVRRDWNRDAFLRAAEPILGKGTVR